MLDIRREIIEAAAQGDISAFEQIYKEFFAFVSNVVYRTVGNIEEAEDVTQEVFMKIYRNLKNFRFESSLKTWIYRITTNTGINYLRKISKHRHVSLENADFLAQDLQSSQAIREGIDLKERENLVSELLGKLNPDQKECIVLRSFEGLSYQQISEVLNIPLNTVRSRIKRARETMLALRKEVSSHEMS